jgi:hypothetical protein
VDRGSGGGDVDSGDRLRTAPGTAADDTPAAAPAAPLTDQEKLLRDLPAGFTAAGCAPDDELRSQTRALAVVRCDNGPPPGAVTAVFARFDSAAHLDTAFSDTATGLGIVVAPDDQIELCRTGGSTRQQWGDERNTLGQVGCVVDPNGVARLLWTRTETLTLCSARRSDGNAAALYDWWAGIAAVPA